MTKYVKVNISTPYDEFTDYVEVGDEISEKEVEETAADTFYNRCNYGFKLVDESEVPEDER